MPVDKALRPALLNLLLSMADDKFFLGHLNGDWTGLGPFLEEDIAFSNIAQDEIAHAQELYRLAAALTDPEGDAIREANRLAYARPPSERLSATLMEVPDEYDWAVAVARQFGFDHFDQLRLVQLGESTYRPLATLAGKMLQEVSFHISHFDGWIRKLGQGTEESRSKLQSSFDHLWCDFLGLFEQVPQQDTLQKAGIDPGFDEGSITTWRQKVATVMKSAGIDVPTATQPNLGGRMGKHGDFLGELINQIAEVYHVDPTASW